MKTKFSATATHATQADATQAAPGAGKRLIITGFIASSDTAGAIMTLVEDIGDTAVIKLQVQVGIGFIAHKLATPIVITANLPVTVRITGTTACKANILGVITSN